MVGASGDYRDGRGGWVGCAGGRVLWGGPIEDMVKLSEIEPKKVRM